MKKLPLLLILSIIGISLLMLGGCERSHEANAGKTEKNQTVNKELILYYPGEDALHLVAEKRIVTLPADSNDNAVAESIVNELIKGPENEELYRSIPEESCLLSLEIADGIAMVNFNQDFQSKHWGGTTGERITLSSLVNSLVELESIEKVQILVEGQVLESLAGHADTSQPIGKIDFNR